MPYNVRRSSIDLLEPRTAADRRALYELVRDALRPTGAPAEAIQLLALAAVRHLSGNGGRIMLSGENSQAKHTLVRALTEALDLPYLEVDVGSLAETNWRGADVPFYLERLHAQLEQRFARSSVPQIARRACILLTHIERVRVPGAYTGGSSTRDYREGKALSLCPLVGEGVIPVPRESGGYLWPSKQALVIAEGRFDGLGSRLPDAEALEIWGIPRPLAEALAASEWIELTSPNLVGLEALIRAELQALVDRFLSYGYHLRIADQVVRYLLDLLTSGIRTGGVAGAVPLVAASADRILARLLEQRTAPGTMYVLARDDIDRSLGEPSSSIWRE